jgi:glycerol-3-phosphate dehydrogenase
MTQNAIFDLLIIGGGINGAAIAREAAGRNLSVCLVEQGDLAQATSSASSKLAHGGLRYLARGDIRLVRESLQERQILLQNAPHICWPLRFIMPHVGLNTPRPMVRAGLWIYDHLGGRSTLPTAQSLKLAGKAEGRPLQPQITHGFSYSDAWVEDTRLTVLNAIDAKNKGASIRTRIRFEDAHLITENGQNVWRIRLSSSHGHEEVRARKIINAAGPWVGELHRLLNPTATTKMRFVQGSHLILPRLYDGPHAYILPNHDGRIVFALPFERDFTIIGTTDHPLTQAELKPSCTTSERDYLLDTISEFFRIPVDPSRIVSSYAGIRALYDDGKANAKDITRDYHLIPDHDGASLHVYGGKITTARHLAQTVVDRLTNFKRSNLLGFGTPSWSAHSALPGGNLDLPRSEWIAAQQKRYSFLDPMLVARYASQFGSRIESLLEGCTAIGQLGHELAPGLFEIEVDWLKREEFAQTAEDILWRRTRLGIRLTPQQTALLAERL